MWMSISDQHFICPSSLVSRACFSHRTRPSTISLGDSAQDEGGLPGTCPIWQRDRSCASRLSLFSAMRSAFSLCPLHPVSPVLWGRALKEATRRSVYTHDANGYQATLSDRCLSKLQVLSVSSTVGGVSVAGHLVSHDTPHPWNILKDERGCNLRVWDAGPE